MTPIENYNRRAMEALSEPENLYLFEQGTRDFQEAHGLKVDGWCGPKTQMALHARGGIAVPDALADTTIPTSTVEVPRGYSGIKRVYGNFDGQYIESPDQPGAIIIDKKWRYANISGVRLHTGQRIWINNVCAEEVPGIFKRACDESGYTPSRIGSFVSRRKFWSVDPKTGLSTHTWAIAIDFDAPLNRYGWALSRTIIGQHIRFAEVWEEAGWQWGGRYGDPVTGKRCDAMHFQRATGV